MTPQKEELRTLHPDQEIEVHRRWLVTLMEPIEATTVPTIAATSDNVDTVWNQAMAEAFCSNRIEGTLATWDEAREFMQDWTRRPRRQAPHAIREDLKDIRHTFRETYEQACDPWDIRDAKDFMVQAGMIHRRLFRHRPEYRPGQWKEVLNRGGRAMFAWPQNVEPLLQQTWELSQEVPAGLARAMVRNFGFINTHPFENGNGRTGRILMNNDLSLVGLERCVMTLTHKEHIVRASDKLRDTFDASDLPNSYIACQQATHQRDWSDVESVMRELQNSGELGDRRVNADNDST